jgi:hypothetical protein
MNEKTAYLMRLHRLKFLIHRDDIFLKRVYLFLNLPLVSHSSIELSTVQECDATMPGRIN